MKALAEFIGTTGYVGHLRPAPGTWGSLAALPLALALYLIGGAWLFGLVLLVMFPVGLWATQTYIAGSDNHDPSEIVVDELVGQWIALLPVLLGASYMGVAWYQLYPGWIAGFALFRLFDIWKPWLVGRADRRGDALGVMLDDVWAGVFAAIGVIALAALFHLAM